MSMEMIKFLAYGLFGERLFDAIQENADSLPAVISFGVIAAVTVAAICFMFHFKKAKRYLSILLVIAVYICLIGLASAIAMLIIWLILVFLVHMGDDEDTAAKPASEDDSPFSERNVALKRLKSLATQLEPCLNESGKSDFIADFRYYLYHEEATADDIKDAIQGWEYYRFHPMPGSKNNPE